MREISCDMCMDLIPLVQDGIASEDSRKAVEQHVQGCETCAAFYDGKIPPPVNPEKLMGKVMRKVHFFSVALMMFGIFFGLGLTAGDEIFYNSLLMPVIGVLGYIIFRWKALYAVPLLMLLTNCLSFCLNIARGVEHWDLDFSMMWTVIYSIFVAVGVVIAGLLHFAFRKERRDE